MKRLSAERLAEIRRMKENEVYGATPIEQYSFAVGDLLAEIDALHALLGECKEVLSDIASGELGINVSRKAAARWNLRRFNDDR